MIGLNTNKIGIKSTKCEILYLFMIDLKKFLPVFRRRDAEIFLEHGAEILRIIEAHEG